MQSVLLHGAYLRLQQTAVAVLFYIVLCSAALLLQVIIKAGTCWG
jgi:hypothetical protein